MIRRTVAGTLGIVVALLVACSSSYGPASPPPTLADRCEQSCAVPRNAGHPCAGHPVATSCQQTCETTLGGKSDECVSCWLSSSGWRGKTCSCTNALGFGDIACESCSWRGNGKSCGTDLINKCTAGQTSCEGWVATPIDDPVCAVKCGAPSNELLNRCQNACLPPRDRDHPCSNSATRAQIDACETTCMQRLSGKSEACATCYLTGSAWLGETCTDCSGSSCTACNWYGNSSGSSKSCGPSKCNPNPQCRGFQDIGLQNPACAALCGVAPSDGGTDAATDAATDAPSDAGEPPDASDGGN